MSNIEVKNYYNTLNEYLKAKLFYAALELDIFSFLDTRINVDDLVQLTEYDKSNLRWFLLALVSEGYIEKDNEYFVNTKSSKTYLSKNSDKYIGNALLSKKYMLDIHAVPEKVRYGVGVQFDAKNSFKEVYNFKEVALASGNEIRLFRSESFINSIKSIFSKDDAFTFLDLGGGSGMLSIILCEQFPNAHGVVFEEESVALVAQDCIKKNKLEDRIKTVSGNFIHDEIGTGYDLIIASGIFHFAKNYLDEIIEKIFAALNQNGYLYSFTKTVSEDYTEPKGVLTKWLSSFFAGKNFLLNGDMLYKKLVLHNFIKLESIKDALGAEIYKKKR